MPIFILSNRKIIRYKDEALDSFSNDEYSLPNFRIAKCNYDSNRDTSESDKKKKANTNRKILDYKILSEPEDYGYAKV